jgi:outer membrane protein
MSLFSEPRISGVMARRIGLAALFLLTPLLLTSTAWAQQPLTLDEALAAALARNPALAAARAQTDRAAADVATSRGGWFPRVTLSEGVQRGDQPVFAFGALLSARQFTAADFALARLNSPGATNLFTTRLGVGQLIFDGGRTSGSVAESQARRDVALAGADEATVGVMVWVTSTYGQLLRMQAAVRAVDSAVAAATEDLTRAEHRRDAGTVTDADVLAVAVHLSSLQQRRLQLDADRATTAAQLNRLMGAAVDAPIVVADVAPPARLDGELAALFVEAEAARPELRRADAQVRMAHAGARQASSIWWPQVAAQAGVEWNGITAGDRARSWVVGAEARWSLSLSGADRARITAAASARTAAESMRDDLRASVRAEVLAAVRQVETAVARVNLGTKTVAQATERARVVRNRYDAGLASMTDVLAAASALLDAEATRTSATVDVLTTTTELHRALGRLSGK